MTLVPVHQQILNTDLYQLTMAAGYHQQKRNHLASFELYVRRLPQQRNFLVAAGLEQALAYLENLRFEADEIAWLREHPAFTEISDTFFESLQNFRFEGEVWALPEGSIFFPYTPILRVTAPLIQAQIVETYLLSLLNYQISVASKAARIQLILNDSSRPCQFMDFGSRRAHGPQASLLAARAAFIGGAAATSNVLAGRELNIPVKGTAAHAWTMAFDTEAEAFQAYHASFPHNSILLVDTYDTLQGVRNAIATSPEIQGIRLDSGDFLELSLQSRQILDDAGLKQAIIVVSGDMNEFRIAELLNQGAPIDAFGVGTELVTSIDAPSLGGVYKLVEWEAAGQTHFGMKLSSNKLSYPGCKQLYRQFNAAGQMQQDLLCLAAENAPGEAQLVRVMQNGQRCQPSETLDCIQARLAQNLKHLPDNLKNIHEACEYPVEKSSALQQLTNQVHQTLVAQHIKA